MSRGEAVVELARLTAILVDAVEVGDMDAARRVLATRAAVVADAETSPAASVADPETIAAAALALRTAEGRVRAMLTGDIAASQAAIGALAVGVAAATAYEGDTGMAAGYVDVRD